MTKLPIVAAITVATSALAQRPANVSICDHYATALLGASNATTQKTLVALVVNTAVIGNYTTPNKLAVPGILAERAEYNGTTVSLLPYFNGALKSTNDGGEAGVSVNFLDDGGAEPLKMNKAADGMESNQYKLMSHLYSYFGHLLGCSALAGTKSSSDFPAYAGDKSMYETHKFMALNAYQVQYFIQQVGLSAASFGVATEDVTAVGEALQGYFGVKCAPETEIIMGQGKELQSICIAEGCPEAPDASCKAYGKVVKPEGTELDVEGGSDGEDSDPTSTGSPGGMPQETETKKSAGSTIGYSIVATGLVMVGLLSFFA
ncbi:hypothetical protein LTR37_001593 [Vermiconidia calcicola]|uniref:Uncharacterized protein n=1 Tax=Vermiconidia calcicola TaxID=1690605 RepID=A0ACC3NV49_9PEZI|nr:hypothetical protein LTR37_001593 [Vermiconidia calcicola]